MHLKVPLNEIQAKKMKLSGKCSILTHFKWSMFSSLGFVLLVEGLDIFHPFPPNTKQPAGGTTRADMPRLFEKKKSSFDY